MPVKIRLSWKHQVTSTMTCHTELFPHKFQTKTQNLAAFSKALKKIING